MHNLWTRANAVFFYALTVLFFLAMGSAFSTYWIPPTYKVNRLALRHLKTLRPQQESRETFADRAIVTFDIDADLRGVFNWNVKQLFVYVTATYSTSVNPFNEVVIWDRIVNRTIDARIRLTDVFNKYPIIDQGGPLAAAGGNSGGGGGILGGLRGVPITLAVHWDVMPITGLLYKTDISTTTVRMPAMYCTETECRPEPIALQEVKRRLAMSDASGEGGAVEL